MAFEGLERLCGDQNDGDGTRWCRTRLMTLMTKCSCLSHETDQQSVRLSENYLGSSQYAAAPFLLTIPRHRSIGKS